MKNKENFICLICIGSKLENKKKEEEKKHWLNYTKWEDYKC